MLWKDKINQLTALLEKMPQSQSYDTDKGVYQPYFILEFRPSNWEVIPYTEYTRLDGFSGKEAKLTLQLIESQKVNICQEELNFLVYIYSFTHQDSRRLFSYGQPIGFLLDWLRGSRIKMRLAEMKDFLDVEFYEETGQISLAIFRKNEEFVLQPAIMYSDHNIVLDDDVQVLTANPIYLLYQNKLHRVESNMSAFFWINFFRVQQQIVVPSADLQEFINSFVSKILPAFDWKSLEEHLNIYELPLTSTKIYLQERAGQFSAEIKFQYKELEFDAQPKTEKSLASQGKFLFIVKRDQERESEIRSSLQAHGLFYIQHRWQIDPQINVLDWIRLEIPKLEKHNVQFFGEDQLKRFRLQKEKVIIQLNISTHPDWLNVNFKIQMNNNVLDIPDFNEQIRKNKEYMRLKDGSYVFIGNDLLQKFKRFFSIVESCGTKGLFKVKPTALPLLQELTKISDILNVDEQYKELEKLYNQFNNIQPVRLSKQFNGELRDYQKAGLNWLMFLNRFRFGGVLADDMGLGKTIQVIALIQKLKNNKNLKNPALIVVPLTVLFNWYNEIDRFAPDLKVLRYQGQRADRQKRTKSFKRYHIVLLSYGIFLQDINILDKFSWDYLVLDESQKIKNPTTKTYQAAISINVSNRLCLTGTPVENSLMDLWAQLNFLNPGMLGTQKQFEQRFGKNGDIKDENQQLLKKIINPYILRRKKEDVLKELPERTDIIQMVDMTDLQNDIYMEWLKRFRNQVFDQMEKEGLNKVRIKVLEALTYLRQLACHPAIFDESIDVTESGKVQLLEDMLEDIIEGNHKVLVFSQYVRFLSIVRKILHKNTWKYEYLDGSTRKREIPIKNFQNNRDIKIFLMSLKAGGLGLNLTAADYVIHLDPWWNPAVEQQATDRAHRIGQEKRVFVYKYIVKNSVEEKILELQKKKKEISDRFIVSEQGLVKNLTKEDLQYIFQPIDNSDK
jgi:non-specific serine/threonine protein kinase